MRAWGPGLECGIVGKSADFVVEAVGDNVGTLGESRVLPSARGAGSADSSKLAVFGFCLLRVLRGRSVSGQDRMRRQGRWIL